MEVLTFRALALRSKRQHLPSPYGGITYLINSFDLSNFLCFNFPPTQHQFLLETIPTINLTGVWPQRTAPTFSFQSHDTTYRSHDDGFHHDIHYGDQSHHMRTPHLKIHTQVRCCSTGSGLGSQWSIAYPSNMVVCSISLKLLYNCRFSRYSAPIHWLVHGHMTSNNETVYRLMPREGNIAKIMMTNGKQFTVTCEMLPAVTRDQSVVMSFVNKVITCFPPVWPIRLV